MGSSRDVYPSPVQSSQRRDEERAITGIVHPETGVKQVGGEIKADLHVHSRYSEAPTEWFMERFQVAESYSNPLLIYRKAKKAGMDFVAITDHNSISGALLLKESHPSDVIVGVEATASFPEDGCHIHLLLYGISEQEFNEVQKLRGDIYELRDYVREKDLAHSVAHATYSVNGRLTVDHIEKLIVLFDVFEGINGGRSKADNTLWMNILQGLSIDRFEALCRKHRLQPYGPESWVKGLTGGSDDHGGIFIGRTFTVTRPVPTIEAFLANLRHKRTYAEGKCNDYRTLALTVYKVVHDYSTNRKGNGGSPDFVGRVSDLMFEGKRLGFFQRLQIRTMKVRGRRKGDTLRVMFCELLDRLEERKFASVDDMLDEVYGQLTLISDEFAKRFFRSLTGDLARIDFLGILDNIAALLPGILLSLPFMVTLKHLNRGKSLSGSLMERFDRQRQSGRRILWFTDTLADLNGVSITLQEIGWHAHAQGIDLKIVTAIAPEDLTPDLPPNIVNLPFVYQFNLPYYERYVLKLPSLLASLKEMYALAPDRIFISTPGPLGLMGLIAARLLHVPCIGVYHTDFTLESKEIVNDASVAGILESYTRWFYNQTDEIRVPTAVYRDMLEQRGLAASKMTIFRRGINSAFFSPRVSDRRVLEEQCGIRDGISLLYAGRISQDKGLGFLARLYLRLCEERSDLNLIIAGDGPYFDEMRGMLSGTRAVFTGRVGQETLPGIYGASELFLFPSTTDTFGKAVLEAQSCGLPAIVSNMGGPQEIVVHGKTGYVADAGSFTDWEAKIRLILDMIESRPEAYRQMRKEARTHVVDNFHWDSAFVDITDEARIPDEKEEKKIA